MTKPEELDELELELEELDEELDEEELDEDEEEDEDDDEELDELDELDEPVGLVVPPQADKMINAAHARAAEVALFILIAFIFTNVFSQSS